MDILLVVRISRRTGVVLAFLNEFADLLEKIQFLFIAV